MRLSGRLGWSENLCRPAPRRRLVQGCSAALAPTNLSRAGCIEAQQMQTCPDSSRETGGVSDGTRIALPCERWIYARSAEGLDAGCPRLCLVHRLWGRLVRSRFGWWRRHGGRCRRKWFWRRRRLRRRYRRSIFTTERRARRHLRFVSRRIGRLLGDRPACSRRDSSRIYLRGHTNDHELHLFARN